jgi:hypothetical protein
MVRNSVNPGIFDPVRIIFNLAISPWDLPDRSTPFPSTMHIDYLKVYQLKDPIPLPDTSISAIDLKSSGITDTITLGGGGSVSFIPENESRTFRATEMIEINGEFTVPLGAELYLDVNQKN